MSVLTLLFVCVQICLIQNVYSQCIGGGPLPAFGPGFGPALAPAVGPYGMGLAGSPFGLAPTALELGAPGSYGFAPAAIELAAGYGGSGVGDVAVAGEMPVAGTTLVAGQVPIIGAVHFAGELPAAGTVSITGSCGCGCGNPYYY
ncbi:chorion class CA protein ERA.5-like [Melitaea cinxia]|uniref:chorion class CA protein ERA.5-like n=1 Tax=Melitaea cinxia TaxID=113334 RepID=UPI001E270DB8|nr:chorion class CA protein ERA.5-like [Melitaea cinxia]